MDILTNSPSNFKPISPLRSARANAFLEYLEIELCAVYLDEKLYKHWFSKGWSKKDVDNAINDLAAQHIISVASFHRGEIVMGIHETKDLKISDGGSL